MGTDGRSTVVDDGEPRVVFRFGRPDDPHVATPERLSAVPDSVAPNTALVAELWATSGSAAVGCEDPTVDVTSWDVECPPGSTRFRIVRYGPMLFAPLHRTNTLDHDVVLSGEVDLLLEDGSEVRLQPGDAAVIPGIVHAPRAAPRWW